MVKIMDNNYLDKLFKSNSFKREMDINIKQILMDRPVKCSFEFNSYEKECYTDGKRIVIGKLDELKDLDEIATYALIKGLVGHEASHIKWSNFKDLKAFNEQIIKMGYKPNLALSIANILEDGRIERLLCKYLKGFSKYIDFLNIILIYRDGNIEDNGLLSNIINTLLFLAKLGAYPENYTDIFSKEEQNLIESELEPIVLKSIISKEHKAVLDLTIEVLNILSKFNIDINSDIIENSSGLNKIFEDNLDPGYNTSEGGDCSDDFSESESTTPKSLQDAFKMDLNASSGDSDKNELDNNSENTVSDDDAKSNNISRSTNDSNNNDVDSESNSSNKQNIINELRDKIYKDFNESKRNFNSDNYENNTKCSEDFFKNLDLNSINEKYDSYLLKEVDFKYEEVDAPYTPYPPELNLDIKILEKQFRNLLKNNDDFVKNQKRGRIDTSKLWKINTIYDNNVFLKKNIQNDSDYAVYILIDLSGSMNKRLKYKHAINTAIKIEGSLVNLPGVKVKTVGFDYTNHSRLRVFKDFNEKKSKTPNALVRNYTGDCNRDGFAIRVALEDLKQTNAKNTLLIIISDGRPAWDGERTEDAMNDVKDAVHTGRKDTVIMSVLINEGEIQKYIKDAFYYMYEDKGTVMANIENEPELLLSSIVLYLKKLFKKR